MRDEAGARAVLTRRRCDSSSLSSGTTPTDLYLLPTTPLRALLFADMIDDRLEGLGWSRVVLVVWRSARVGEGEGEDDEGDTKNELTNESWHEVMAP